MHKVLNNNRKEIRESILAVGLKATQQRILILETLLNLHEEHPTAEEVFQKLGNLNPGISLGTIYKTLDSFVEAGMVKRVLCGNSRRYDINDHAHGHIYCLNTQEIIDYSDPELQTLIQEYFKAKEFQNFNLQDISIQIIGNKLNPEQGVIIN